MLINPERFNLKKQIPFVVVRVGGTMVTYGGMSKQPVTVPVVKHALPLELTSSPGGFHYDLSSLVSHHICMNFVSLSPECSYFQKCEGAWVLGHSVEKAIC